MISNENSALRLPAEWEPQSAIQLTFPHAGTDWAPMLDAVVPVFVSLAETIARYEKVLVVCENATETRRLLAGIPESRLICCEVPSNDTWARDHGGIVVETNAGLKMLDFVFNGWGMKFAADKDNLITGHLHRQGIFKIPLEHGGLALEGGGIESDGMGTLLTTAECMLSANRNPHLSKPQIEAALTNLFGLQRILWLEHGFLEGDDTDSHIDTLARFCSPDTIAYVRCDDPSDAHYKELHLMEQELTAFRTAEGKPYKLVPLPWPQACFDPDDGHRLPATYANFLFLNGAVLVPTYEVPQDEQALEIFRNLFPDRDVIGVNCSALIRQHGSLHCVTMQYPNGVV